MKIKMNILIHVAVVTLCIFVKSEHIVPVVITTWKFTNASVGAWNVLKSGGSALDAIQKGASVCEAQQCDGTVGYGGSPDEHGETTLDALIMDGTTMNVGAVGGLRRIKHAIAVARHVLDHTKHSILVGELATQFAVDMGFVEENLSTANSKAMWKKWYNDDHCQPNFWMDVSPNPNKFCGPYSEPNSKERLQTDETMKVDQYNHDTIGLIAIDQNANIAAGTSTNGAKFKIPGRVGDSPIPGAGAYADSAVGGAAGTGDGDVMLRFLPSFLAVEEMRHGSPPTEAARVAIKRITDHYPHFMGAVIALRKDGTHGAACHGISTFPYVIHDNTKESYQIKYVDCS